MEILTAPSPNWYSSGISDVSQDGTLAAYACNDKVLLISTGQDKSHPRAMRLLHPPPTLHPASHVGKITSLSFVRVQYLYDDPPDRPSTFRPLPPTSPFLITGSSTKSLTLWNPLTGAALRTVRPHAACITAVACLHVATAAEAACVSADSAGKLALWRFGANEAPTMIDRGSLRRCEGEGGGGGGASSEEQTWSSSIHAISLAACPHRVGWVAAGMSNGSILIVDVLGAVTLVALASPPLSVVHSLSWWDCMVGGEEGAAPPSVSNRLLLACGTTFPPSSSTSSSTATSRVRIFLLTPLTTTCTVSSSLLADFAPPRIRGTASPSQRHHPWLVASFLPSPFFSTERSSSSSSPSTSSPPTTLRHPSHTSRLPLLAVSSRAGNLLLYSLSSLLTLTSSSPPPPLRFTPFVLPSPHDGTIFSIDFARVTLQGQRIIMLTSGLDRIVASWEIPIPTLLLNQEKTSEDEWLRAACASSRVLWTMRGTGGAVACMSLERGTSGEDWTEEVKQHDSSEDDEEGGEEEEEGEEAVTLFDRSRLAPRPSTRTPSCFLALGCGNVTHFLSLQDATPSPTCPPPVALHRILWRGLPHVPMTCVAVSPLDARFIAFLSSDGTIGIQHVPTGRAAMYTTRSPSSQLLWCKFPFADQEETSDAMQDALQQHGFLLTLHREGGLAAWDVSPLMASCRDEAASPRRHSPIPTFDHPPLSLSPVLSWQGHDAMIKRVVVVETRWLLLLEDGQCLQGGIGGETRKLHVAQPRREPPPPPPSSSAAPPDEYDALLIMVLNQCRAQKGASTTLTTAPSPFAQCLLSHVLPLETASMPILNHIVAMDARMNQEDRVVWTAVATREEEEEEALWRVVSWDHDEPTSSPTFPSSRRVSRVALRVEPIFVSPLHHHGRTWIIAALVDDAIAWWEVEGDGDASVKMIATGHVGRITALSTYATWRPPPSIDEQSSSQSSSQSNVSRGRWMLFAITSSDDGSVRRHRIMPDSAVSDGGRRKKAGEGGARGVAGGKMMIERDGASPSTTTPAPAASSLLLTKPLVSDANSTRAADDVTLQSTLGQHLIDTASFLQARLAPFASTEQTLPSPPPSPSHPPSTCLPFGLLSCLGAKGMVAMRDAVAMEIATLRSSAPRGASNGRNRAASAQRAALLHLWCHLGRASNQSVQEALDMLQQRRDKDKDDEEDGNVLAAWCRHNVDNRGGEEDDDDAALPIQLRVLNQLAKKNVSAALSLLKDANFPRDALLLAQLRLPATHPALVHDVATLAEQVEASCDAPTSPRASYFEAALLFLAAGNVRRAACATHRGVQGPDRSKRSEVVASMRFIPALLVSIGIQEHSVAESMRHVLGEASVREEKEVDALRQLLASLPRPEEHATLPPPFSSSRQVYSKSTLLALRDQGRASAIKDDIASALHSIGLDKPS